MFAQILRTQWIWTRTTLGAIAAGAFVTPAFIWRLADSVTIGSSEAAALIEGFAALGVVLAIIALFGAFILAALPWGVDAAAQHVYPLSLPVPWRRYLAMRYAAGALSLILPSLALWLGGTVTLALITVPEVLQSYAGALAFRFFLAALLSYSATFALQYLAGRRAVVSLLLVLLTVVLVVFVVGVLGGRDDLVEAGLRFLFEWPGPLAIYTEPWMLLDV